MGDTIKGRALETLRRFYGYSDFRPGQWEVIESLIEGRDTVVLMPTGGGKSLCFQLPALMAEGCCVVVSPLIALMNDQVAALRANGIPARAINSMLPESDNRAAYAEASRGELKLLYISPERLLSDMEMITRSISVSFVAVDEAHCISQWGHDFRPVYTDLIRIKEQWPDVRVMALTATADRLTREDISKALGLIDPYVWIGSFDRPNLSLQVITGAKVKERLAVITRLVAKYPMDCGIVYCLSRKKTEDMARRLTEEGIRTGCYHAGMSSEEREKVQREFVNGRLQAICATIAFGMGIDKSNVRWVVHNNIPGNIESYYQEIGRAGRDGLPAETILFYSYADIITRRSFVEESGRVDINSSKLDFMQRYAEASVCRRRILLSYLSEDMDHDCGNCDNCRNPRGRFDGTVLAQKALSAIVRVDGSEGINVIIEILRGMSRHYIISKGYNRLRTYGVGKDMDTQEWHQYILQMIQLGLIEVAYEENFHLRPTESGWKVLRGERTVELATYIRPVYVSDHSVRGKDAALQKVRLTPGEKLAMELKTLRAGWAGQEGIADYMVLSDVSLEAIVRQMPDTLEDLMRIEGMSMVKLSKYYKGILQAVKRAKGVSIKLPTGISDEVSGLMFRNGMDMETIAGIRNIQTTTVLKHLCNRYEQGDAIDLWRIVPHETYLTTVCLIDLCKKEIELMPIAEEEKPKLPKYLEEKHSVSGEIYSRVSRIRAVLDAAKK